MLVKAQTYPLFPPQNNPATTASCALTETIGTPDEEGLQTTAPKPGARDPAAAVTKLETQGPAGQQALVFQTPATKVLRLALFLAALAHAGIGSQSLAAGFVPTSSMAT